MILEEIFNKTNYEFRLTTDVYEGPFYCPESTANVSNYSKHLLNEQVRNSEVTHIVFANRTVYIKM